MRGLFLAILALATATAVWAASPNTTTLSQEVYVWQRVWSPTLRHSLSNHSSAFDGIVFLQTEVTWRRGKPDIATVPVDMEFPKTLKKPVGLALRIGTWPAAESDKTAPWLADLAAKILENAKTNGLEISEFQIDFDCAESRLDNYRVWLNAIRKRIQPTPLVFTALPSWLKRSSFLALAKASDGFILQVHSLERPQKPDTAFQLCDPAHALRAVQKANEAGVAFRVALPTYGYALAFDRTDRFIGLSAEGPSLKWPDDSKIMEVRADAVAMAGLVRCWNTNAPSHLKGILWYRFPMPGDRLNWSWKTLESVMAGKVPTAHLEAKVSTDKTGLVNLVLANTGSGIPTTPIHVTVHWQEGRKPIAYDAYNQFSLNQLNATTLVFTSNRPVPGPGEHLKIGWLRFEDKTEVQLEITP